MISFFKTFTPLQKLQAFLFLKAIFIIFIILFAGISLGPDEAQYWTWSQSLDWGYYSKPPGIAWQIWLGTKLFGQTELGIRFPSVILAFFQSILIYWTAKKGGFSDQLAFWSGLIMAFSPIGILGSFFAITDGGMLFCWTGACLVMVSALYQKKSPDPLLLGSWILVGSLFKWTIFSFWIYFFIFRYLFFPQTKISACFTGVLLSILGFLPSIYWNVFHDWATFRHVIATIGGGSVQQAGGNFFEFIGSQALLISPILFILLLASFLLCFRLKGYLSPVIMFCSTLTISLLGIAITISLFQKVQGNWVDFAYPTAIILIVWTVNELKCIHWMKIGLYLSVCLTIMMIFLASLFSVPPLSEKLNFKWNPLKHNMGWIELEKNLKIYGYEPNENFLLSDKYQTTSILSFYSENKKRAFFMNLQGMRRNQFSYWPSLFDTQSNKTGFFIWVENQPHFEKSWEEKKENYINQLRDYFEKVEFIAFTPLIYDQFGPAKIAIIIKCENCKKEVENKFNYF